MKYVIKRYSKKSEEESVLADIYEKSLLNKGVSKLNEVSEDLINDPNIKDTRFAKRQGKFIRDLTYLLKRDKKNKKKKNFSTKDSIKSPSDVINMTEVNKFNVGLRRIVNSQGDSTSNSILD